MAGMMDQKVLMKHAAAMNQNIYEKDKRQNIKTEERRSNKVK